MSENGNTRCQWYADSRGDFWITSCQGRGGHRWMFDEGGPIHHNLSACPYCSRPIEIIETPADAPDAVDVIDGDES